MKRVIALTAAALMSGGLFAAPALAQVSVDTGVGANVGVGTNADTSAGSASGTVGGTVGTDAQIKTDASGAAANTNVDSGTTAAVGASWDNLMSALGDTGASASIGAMSDVGTVHVIRISELGNTDADALAKAKSDNQASIDQLKTSIEGNAKVKAALEQQGVDPSTIVAANVAADGALTVYVE